MIHLAICDDERAQVTHVSALARKWAEQRVVLMRLSSFESAESCLFQYEEDRSFDILLLDIQMKAMDGMALARALRKDNDRVQIVFITGYTQYAAEGYDVSALHYLMKPVREDKLFEVLDRALAAVNQPERSLLVNSGGEILRLPFRELRYVEIQGHYAKLYLTTGAHSVKMSLSELTLALDSAFFRCQRSYVVNLAFVRRITRTAMVLNDGAEIPLSRDLYEAANRAVIDYFP